MSIFRISSDKKIATELLASAIRRLIPGRRLIDTGVTSVRGIDAYCPQNSSRKSALLILSPGSWHVALKEFPNIRKFNFVGLTFEMTRALNLRGYVVDIVDYRKPEIPPMSRYDVVVAHGPNCHRLCEQFEQQPFIVHYASGAYWRRFNEMSSERYRAFCARRGVPIIPKFARSMRGTEEGEEYIARRADATFISGPRTLSTWLGISKKLKLVYLGSYVEKDLIVDHDFEAGRRNFIYVAGTGGNIQKGLDILLEAFSKCPDHNLYVYCNVEDEVRQAYKNVFQLPNIRYIYHLRFGPFRKRLARMMKQINFTISAPIDTGPGTAFVGSLGLGLIPVGYVDIGGTPEQGCFSSSWSIDEIRDTVRFASSQSVDWYRKASLCSLERYRSQHDPESFQSHFGSFLGEILPQS